VSGERTRPRLGLVLGAAITLALMTLTGLAIGGVILSQVETISGKRGGTLRVVSVSPIGELDPARVQTAFAVSMLHAVQRTPYASQPRRGVVPDLALGPAEISNDSRRLEITLRTGVHFAPPVNREVTSADIAYAIERGFLPSVDSDFAKLYFSDIEGVKAFRAGRTNHIAGLETPDDHTLVIVLDQPTARVAAAALALPIAAPVPRNYASRFDQRRTSSYGRHQVGTGPYRFEPAADGLIPPPSTHRIALARNPNWDSGNDFREAFVSRIQVAPAPGLRSAEHEVLRGRDTVSGDFAASGGILRAALEGRRDQVTLTDSGSIRYESLNTRIPPLDNIQVRLALTAAFDRAAARRVLGGHAVGHIATHWIPPGVPGFEEAGGDHGFDFDFLSNAHGNVSLARSYMRAAGYESGRYHGKAKLVAIGSREQKVRRTAAVVRQAFRRVGIPLRVRFVGPGVVLERCSVPRTTPAVCLDSGWVKDFDDAQTILQPLFSGKAIRRQQNANSSLFNDAEANDAIRSATITTGQADRAEAWARADQTITDLAPALPVIWDRYPLLTSADVKGVVDEGLGQWDLSFTSLK
jgi:peptide/nickel transport system substrate-binding protein